MGQFLPFLAETMTHTEQTLSATVEWVIPFHDLDPLEVCWHGHYARYLELARTALLQKIDYDCPQMKTSGYVWPVIELHIRYAQPLRYQQKIQIVARLKEWENRLKVNYEILDADSGRRLTRAHTIQVAVDARNGEMCFVSPAALQDRIRAYFSQ